MSIPRSVDEVIRKHVVLEVESIDRMYLNVYQGRLQRGGGVSDFFRRHRGEAFFLKFCSYFPYNARLYLNGHEHAKRQLQQKGIVFEALDNGVLSCDDPRRLQAICDGLSAAKIDGLLRKWLAKLPQPFTPADNKAGFRYELSILQSEFSLTQVVDRPLAGRVFFERVIRDNLDLGRPDHVQLIFARRIQRNTPSRFRTRVITQDVIPSLWIDYKSSTIKQYFKEGRALRTETTINNTRDFDIGRRVENLPALRAVAFAANRRLLHVQHIDHDPTIGQDAFDQLNRPMEVDGQRASGLRFGDPVVLAVMTALLMFRLLPKGFSNQGLREKLALLLVRPADQITPGAMSYQLRRLRLRGLIERIAGTHRYRLTESGLRAALFYTSSHSQVIRPLGACLADPNNSPQQRILCQLDALLQADPELQDAA